MNRGLVVDTSNPPREFAVFVNSFANCRRRTEMTERGTRLEGSGSEGVIRRFESIPGLPSIDTEHG